ncbi:hypothetical protein Pla100_63150 [Neorhodopirellula pilleata]|uniref:Uncharacterized protein n=1 Tax=Neorhodopirellula pilleata TaxID=2714738 RepID=A0A5C5YSG2_9BACT|nr:hypothetical protein Pla100_63150 [Neorhodopirellula pilleata]
MFLSRMNGKIETTCSIASFSVAESSELEQSMATRMNAVAWSAGTSICLAQSNAESTSPDFRGISTISNEPRVRSIGVAGCCNNSIAA